MIFISCFNFCKILGCCWIYAFFEAVQKNSQGFSCSILILHVTRRNSQAVKAMPPEGRQIHARQESESGSQCEDGSCKRPKYSYGWYILVHWELVEKMNWHQWNLRLNPNIWSNSFLRATEQFSCVLVAPCLIEAMVSVALGCWENDVLWVGGELQEFRKCFQWCFERGSCWEITQTSVGLPVISWRGSQLATQNDGLQQFYLHSF